MTNWIQGRDLVAVNLAGGFELNSPAEGGDLQTIQLQTGTGVTLPTHDFYLLFPGDTGTGETAEYVYISTRSADTLLCGPDPFLVSPTTGRAAINPVRWPAAHHPASARLELRTVFEVVSQLQARLDAHTHDGTTANGPVLTQNQGTNIVQATNGTGGTLSFGDVVTFTGGVAGTVPSTGYLGLPIGMVYGAQGGPPTGAGDFTIANGDPVYVKISGVGWAHCEPSVLAGNPIQATITTKTVSNLVSPALGAIGFAVTSASLFLGKYYCQVLLVNRGADLLTPNGVQDVKNKTVYSPVLYSSADTTARMLFPTAVANDTLVGVNTAATLLAKTLTSPVINTPTITGGSISGGSISGAAITATGSALTNPAITGGTVDSTIITNATFVSGVFNSPNLGTPNVIASRVFATWDGSTPYSADFTAHVPANTEVIDYLAEWSTITYTWAPTATGTYLFSTAISIVPTTAVYFQLYLKSSAGLQRYVGGGQYAGTTTLTTLSGALSVPCTAGQTYWFEYAVTKVSPTPSMTGTINAGTVGIMRLG